MLNAIATPRSPIKISLPGVDGARLSHVVVRRAVEWHGTRAKLMTCGPSDQVEFEIEGSHHTLILRCDGVTTGAEWDDGKRRIALPPIRPGSISFVAAGSYACRTMKVERSIRFMLLELDCGAVTSLLRRSDAAPHPRFRTVPFLEDPDIRHTLYAIRNEIDRPGPLDALYREGLTALLTLQLARAASDLADLQPRPADRGGLPGWRLRRALDLLEADLESPPSLESLARQIGLSPSHFSHAFKQSMGVPPHQYVIQRRVAEAKALMADRSLNLTEIAMQCGFNGSSQFSTVFRRATGLSPSAYRHEL